MRGAPGRDLPVIEPGASLLTVENLPRSSGVLGRNRHREDERPLLHHAGVNGGLTGELHHVHARLVMPRVGDDRDLQRVEGL
jgi:hypothetical protein